jgi:hypothetical protein
MNKEIKNDTLGAFVDALPMAGRTSLLNLMEAAMFASRDIDFIDATRKLRNTYAHNIKNVDATLISLIKSRSDKKFILKSLSPTDIFDEKVFMEVYEKDHKLLRLMVLISTMRILVMAYHMSVKRARDRSKHAMSVSLV